MKKENFRLFNYSSAEFDPKSLPDVEEIPTLVPEEKMEIISEGDASPFFKLQAIPYPAKGSGGIYEESFFESFVDLMKSKPIPGNKFGHWNADTENDFYTVGGKVDKAKKIAYLKMYVPPMGATTPNDSFKRDLKLNIIEFSLVTSPVFSIDADGVYHFIKTNGWERNDAVQRGAMMQRVNSATSVLDQEKLDRARALITAGRFDRNSKWDEKSVDENFVLAELNSQKYQFGKNGLVYRSALRQLAARAANDGDSDLAGVVNDLIALIDKNSKGGTVKDKVLSDLKTLKENAEISFTEVAAIFPNVKILDETHANAMATVKELNELLGQDVVSSVKEMLAEKKKNADAVRAAKISEIAGPEKLENGQENELRTFANTFFGTNEITEEKIAEFKTNSIAKKLAGERADVTSQVNSSEKQKSQPKKIGGLAKY